MIFIVAVIALCFLLVHVLSRKKKDEKPGKAGEQALEKCKSLEATVFSLQDKIKELQEGKMHTSLFEPLPAVQGVLDLKPDFDEDKIARLEVPTYLRRNGATITE